jgi:uncharacterized membrane protein YccC
MGITPHWRYCVKVGLAAGLGYLLTRGSENEYAIYSAMTAALIVGATVGEDFETSVSRAKGTLAGMVAGVAMSAFFGPSALAVGVAVAGTALLTLALGWGIPVARVGVTVCIVTIVFHGVYALEYDLLRALNTLIGIAVGLAVSFFVWPVRGRDALERALRRALDAARKLLDAMAAGQRDLRPAQSSLYDALGALVKAGKDIRLERRIGIETAALDPRGLPVLQLGLELLAVALAQEGHAPGSAERPSLEALRRRLEELAGSAH